MQIREFSKPITSKQLNESLAEKFGYKINLEQFNDAQLSDAQNKLRTKISQFELSESFDSVLESPEYQKTRMFLDCINQELLEREELADKDYDEDGEVETGKEEHAGSVDKAIKKAKAKTDEGYIASTVRQRASSQSVPLSWINSAINRINLGEGDRAELKAELKLRYDLNESQASWILLEGEEDKAEIIMSTKDMVDRITGWLEDVAAMKAEQLLELLDSIRDQLGSDKSEAFSQAVKPALENLYSTLESSRTTLSQGVGILTGADMGSSMGSEMPMGGTPGEEAFPTGDDFGASEPAAGGDAAAGRAKRESIDYSRKLGMMLAQSKKK
jgi:metal-responsive CopG/Arc/MetJ family transcriptional regulator